ncbi:hypothetical protein X777_12692 [Ooceraea biroi]|uniref:Uncharacterized protein n=1 Tax=Ooceraea biroi TaxID=2015173 RepID=A0A026VZ80_OOCBI|nr:hypothetical protein X777_12692 [Ooceraea biroi]
MLHVYAHANLYTCKENYEIKLRFDGFFSFFLFIGRAITRERLRDFVLIENHGWRSQVRVDSSFWSLSRKQGE